MNQLVWDDDQLRELGTCALCALVSRCVRATALAVVVGYYSDGGGAAKLHALCTECLTRPNVLCCARVPEGGA